MNEQVPSAFEHQIAQAVRTPEPSPEFSARLWRRMIAQAARQPARNQPFHGMKRRVGWALAGLICLALLVGALVIGPERVLAALQTGMSYIRGVGFVESVQGLALREPVELKRGEQSLTVEQLLSSSRETVLTVRLLGFPAYQDVGLDHGMWLALPDGYAYGPGSRSVEVTSLPGEYIGVYKFKPLPDGTSNITVIWQPLPSVPEWQIPLDLVPVEDAEVVRRLPASYASETGAVIHYGISLAVDQVASSASGTAVRLQINFPEDFDFAMPSNADLSDDLGGTYPLIPGEHFEDQGQPIRSVAPGSTGQAVVRNLHSTYEFQPVQEGARWLTLTVRGVMFTALPNLSIRVDLGAEPTVGDVFVIDQTFTVDELSFHVRRARLAAIPADGPALAGLVLDIEPADPSQVLLEQIWLFKTYSDGGYLVEDNTPTWTTGWPVDQIPAGEVDVKIGAIRGTILGEWQIQWEHQEP